MRALFAPKIRNAFYLAFVVYVRIGRRGGHLAMRVWDLGKGEISGYVRYMAYVLHMVYV